MDPLTRTLLSGLLLAPALACDEESPSWPLEDRVFLSQSVIEDGAPRPLVDDRPLWLSFDRRGEMYANAGCNHLHATYRVNEGTFVLSRFVDVTLLICDADVDAQEEWYFDFLVSRPSIVIAGDTIVLETDHTRIEYLDQEVATPDLPLAGPTWTVEMICQGVLVGGSDWPAPATLSFGRDGTVEVFSGCNSGFATYAIDREEITFAELTLTEEGCSDDAAARLEAAVVGVLGGPQPVAWEITVASLYLDGDSDCLFLHGSEGWQPPAALPGVRNAP
jgi:heat shock protein HslJ